MHCLLHPVSMHQEEEGGDKVILPQHQQFFPDMPLLLAKDLR